MLGNPVRVNFDLLNRNHSGRSIIILIIKYFLLDAACLDTQQIKTGIRSTRINLAEMGLL